MSRRAWLLVLPLVVVFIGCDVKQPSTSPTESAAPSTAIAADSAEPSLSVAATPEATPTATPVPTATPTPTPAPTPVPWQSYRSKRFKYSMKYPPAWVVTPGTSKRADAFDDYSSHFVSVSRDTVSGTGSVPLTVSSDIAYMKSHYKAKLLSNKAIKLASGYRGRKLIYNATDSGRKMYVQSVIVGKGRVGYFIRMWSDRGHASDDKALFKRIYKTWKPRS